MSRKISPRYSSRVNVLLSAKLAFCLIVAPLQSATAADALGSLTVGEDALVRKEAGKLIIQSLGEYRQLNELIYLGAVYQPLLATGLAEEGSMRMEMRFVIEEISARRFIRNWMDNISLNASREQRQRLINEIQQFGEIFQHPFVRGDHVAFEYDMEADLTRFTHNDVLMGETRGGEFFYLLRDVWLGDNPKSSDLKTALYDTAANGIATADADVFYALTYDRDRKHQIALHIKEQQEEKLAAQRAEEQRRLEQQRQEEAEALARAKALEEQRLAEEAERLRLARQEEERLRREREQQEAIALARHQEEQEKLRVAFAEKLSKLIGSKVVYPEMALRRGIAGRVEIEVVSDRQGNLLGHSVVTSSGSRILDEEALDTVERSEPLLVMPAELEGDTFTFVMPVAYIFQE